MEKLKESGKLAALISKSTTRWAEAEWGFPKGRRISSETELVCAFRETFEETGVKRQHLTLVSADPLVEEFVGSNGIRYKHKYWLAEMSPQIEVIMDPQNKEQAKEIGDVRWVTLEDAKKLIRPYNTEKLAVLDQAMGAIAVNLSC
jgi:8-oxo-dGTP pyrophosphatase MutT (NUDIX family)